MTEGSSTGLTTTGYGLVLIITALSVAHHFDHVLRDVTGWPVTDEFNAFSVSLVVYPVIVAGLVLSRRNWVGARFWAVLAGGGAIFILVVHVGPAAGDSFTTIPGQYGTAVADIAALVVLAFSWPPSWCTASTSSEGSTHGTQHGAQRAAGGLSSAGTLAPPPLSSSARPAPRWRPAGRRPAW